ncbi:putative quinol monooxygenase [Flavobacterium pectinovorum]|uniref:Antibiotic biosynthesis monooxygenase n=1 Tax=Flavobacterium pectinovorum TaxID=29533 RepID=A0AB36NYP4_9FLAO|nr:antibiotic biosynthesis monooxygenase [Flavobacterium pectinovorum]OXB03684.1 antibiotic biosynthesis monooxygenase [Flavobacterium pectinovorum]SHL62827.1 Quinol monooxygenase YgiN [Flavobacterium pectinovorum]
MKKLTLNLQSNFSKGRFLCLVFTIVFLISGSISAQKKDMMVRIAEIEIYPEHLSQYKVILKEESAASVKLEPGVLAIFPMYQKSDSTQIRIIEIYNDKDAYQSHLKTPHFQKYKTTTTKMVKTLKLVEMNTIDPESMKFLFRKINE